MFIKCGRSLIQSFEVIGILCYNNYTIDTEFNIISIIYIILNLYIKEIIGVKIKEWTINNINTFMQLSGYSKILY